MSDATTPVAPPSETPAGSDAAKDTAKPTPPGPPAPAPALEQELSAAYRAHLDALIAGREQPVPGSEDLVEDLRACAKKQDEARAALQQASQFVQTKQSEASALMGEGTAIVRALKRIEDRAAQKT